MPSSLTSHTMTTNTLNEGSSNQQHHQIAHQRNKETSAVHNSSSTTITEGNNPMGGNRKFSSSSTESSRQQDDRSGSNRGTEETLTHQKKPPHSSSGEGLHHTNNMNNNMNGGGEVANNNDRRNSTSQYLQPPPPPPRDHQNASGGGHDHHQQHHNNSSINNNSRRNSNTNGRYYKNQNPSSSSSNYKPQHSHGSSNIANNNPTTTTSSSSHHPPGATTMSVATNGPKQPVVNSTSSRSTNINNTNNNNNIKINTNQQHVVASTSATYAQTSSSSRVQNIKPNVHNAPPSHITTPSTPTTPISRPPKSSPRFGNPLSDRFHHIEKDISKTFQKQEKLGEGTYGEVHKGIDKRDNSMVAIKKIRIDPQREKEGFPITSIREIRALKDLDHVNIVKLYDVTWNQKGTFYLVFEFVEHDLAGLNGKGHRFDEDELRCIMYQLLSALDYCHARDVMHRDLKASNVLIKKDGTLKLADFGLSRVFHRNKQQEYTNRVVTRWYRPPELLLGATAYDASIDMWSVGCILGEMLLPFAGEKEPKALFPGASDPDQLEKIFDWCGTPSVEDWPEVEKLPHWKSLKPQQPKKRRIMDRFTNLKCSPKVLDLLDKLLTLNPANRITASDSLNHDWFWERGKNPKNCKPKGLPSRSYNELSTRKKDDHRPDAPSHHLIPSTVHPLSGVPATSHHHHSHGASKVASTSSSVAAVVTSSSSTTGGHHYQPPPPPRPPPPFSSSSSSSSHHYHPSGSTSRHSYHPSSSQPYHHHRSHHSSSHGDGRSSGGGGGGGGGGYHHGSSSGQQHYHPQQGDGHGHSSHSNRYSDSGNNPRSITTHHDAPSRSNNLAPPSKKVKY